MNMLRSLFSRPMRRPRRFTVPAGRRVYAIGDIHGRSDLLDRLLAHIAADRATAPRQREHIIFLGDLIDRGPDSRGVIDRLLALRETLPNPVFIAGNHEEMLLRILDGGTEHLADWIRFGGHECLESYGVDPRALIDAPEAAPATLHEAIPAAHIAFLRAMADSARIGDYLFVHAGIVPGVPIERQLPSDTRWIREPFLRSTADHGVMVVHGHTISADVDERRNRIGIDTGAYASGVLTALCIEGGERRFLSTAED
jgi:serine/threonine protein phosphatase 1